MTTERWDDDRLDRLANSVEGLTNRVDNIANSLESLTKRVDSIAIATENNHRLIESNARVIQALANVAVEAREEREQLFQRMDRQQEEIVGLRIETRRMLDILLNQRDQGDNPTA
jgi:methyl-accepting chemotaxis protein